MIKLPRGYELYDPGPALAGVVSDDAALYGGATMSWALDGARVWHLGCNARKNNIFQYRVFRLVGSKLVEVPLEDTGSGRGYLRVEMDGRMYYSAWEGSQTRPAGGPGLVPGAVVWPIPAVPTALAGVTQGEPGAIEVRGAAYAYIDLSVGDDADHGLRLIRTPGRAEIQAFGAFRIVVNGRVLLEG